MDPQDSPRLLFTSIAGGTEPPHARLDGLQPAISPAPAAGKEAYANGHTASTQPHLTSTHATAAYASTKVDPLASAGAKRSLEAALSNASVLPMAVPGASAPMAPLVLSTPTTQTVTLKQGGLGLQPQQSFTIPAFKCLTEDDLILSEELEDGGTLSAAFGELADSSKLGFLPTEDDLKLQLFDPTPPPPALLAPAPHPSIFAPFNDPILLPPSLLPSPFGLQQPLPSYSFRHHHHQQQQQQWQQQQQRQQRRELGGNEEEELEDEEGGQDEEEDEEWSPRRGHGRLFGGVHGGFAEGQTPPSRSSSLGSIKRRMDAIDLEDPGSARAKRSGSISSLLGWEGAPAASAAVSPAAAVGLPRAGSIPQGLSRFSMGGSQMHTPARHAERPGKAAGGGAAHTPRGQQGNSAAFGLVQGGGRGGGAGGGSSAAAAAGAPASFKGVSKHKLTQRWEASLWLAGRQLYLGGFDNQEDAARAYDIAALACKGEGADTNFPPSDYVQHMAEVQGLSRDEVVAYVRRRSSAFSRGRSKFRGVSGHEGRWEARIGSFQGRKNVSFGIFETEEEAARQYDRALILEKGRSAKTNFPIRDYEREVEQYEQYVLDRCGGFGSTEAEDIAQDYTLPLSRAALPLEDKKRSVQVFAEELRQRLRGGGSGAGAGML